MREKISLASWLWALEDRMTLRLQIGIGAALMCLVMIGTLAAGAAYTSSQQVSALLNERLAEVANIMSERLDRYMFTRQRELRLFATLDQNREIWKSDPARLRLDLERVQSSFSDLAWIGYAGPDGKVVAATGGLLQGVSVAARPWFKNGLKNIAVEDVHEAALLATLLEKRVDGEPYRFVDIALPIQDNNGNTLGVLGAHLNWDWARDLRESIRGARQEESEKTDIWILAKDGQILLGPSVGSYYYDAAQFAEIRDKKAGTFVERNGAVPMLTAYSVTDGHRDYGGLGWIVVARRPAAVAFAAASQTGFMILGIGGAIGLCGIAVAMLLASRIARPIQRITLEADRIGRDPSATMLPRLRGSYEAIQLTHALRSLLRRVGFAEERSREIETRAQEDVRALTDNILELKQLAATDPLTNLMNRRAFLDAGKDAIAYHKRYKRGLSALMIDIDHFKKINDTYGHAAGDEVIKGVAAMIDECVRGTDKVARFGGEEFVVLLREADLEATKMLAERIRARVEESVWTLNDVTIRATISVGIAIVADSDRDVQDLIERADQGLYLAKNTGRNRVFQMLAQQPKSIKVA